MNERLGSHIFVKNKLLYIIILPSGYNSLLTINISSMSMFLFLLLAEYLESLLSLVLQSFSVFACLAAASNSLQGKLPTSPL